MASRLGKPNMSPAQEQTFLRLVAMALYPAEAARHVDVTPQAISMRRKRDRAFDERVRSAESKAMFALIARVQEGAKRDWRAALALLERRWPELWARPETRADMDKRMRDLRKADLEASTAEKVARTRAIEQRIDPDTAPDPDPRFE
jgi:hypothetical protein